MKFPTLKGRTSHLPKKALCPWCEKNKVLEPHSFALLGGGALLMDRDEDSGGSDKRMSGFLHMSWHGAHDGGLGNDKGLGATIEIARAVHGGQFELYFCSTKCLRSYLNYCVDELERKLSSERTKPNKSRKSGAVKTHTKK